MARGKRELDTIEVPKLTLNAGQKQADNALRSTDQVILVGGAGTGKTYFSMYCAARYYRQDVNNKIVICRPNEPAGRTLGHFPGTLIEKMGEWVREPLTVLGEFLTPGAVDCGIKNGRIELLPVETMRGRSFKNSFVILDEAQNTTPEQALMFWTRMGENTRTIMNGDLTQSDIRSKNGLSTSITWAEKYDAPAQVITLTQMERDPKVTLWLDAYEDWKYDEEAMPF